VDNVIGADNGNKTNRQRRNSWWEITAYRSRTHVRRITWRSGGLSPFRNWDAVKSGCV